MEILSPESAQNIPNTAEIIRYFAGETFSKKAFEAGGRTDKTGRMRTMR